MTPIQDAAYSYLQGRLARGEITLTTSTHYLERLKSLARSFGERPVNELNRESILEWQASIGHLSPSTRNARLSTARTFCDWLVSEGILETNPVAGLPKARQPRRVPRALPGAAVGKLLAATHGERDRVMVLVMLGCGLRRGEIASLQTGDYDGIARTLLVVGKASHERVVPVPDETAEALDSYLDTVGRRPGPLFRNLKRRGQGLSPRAVSQIVTGLMRSAGIKAAAYDGRSAHALRHTAASDVLDNSHDLPAVQAMLGHASLQTTQVYLRRADLGRLRSAMSGRTYSQTG